MLICSLWTASIQKLLPRQQKRLKCDRFPLGLVSWQQEHWQSRVVGMGYCVLSLRTNLSFHLGHPRCLYQGNHVPLQQDSRSMLPQIRVCLSSITPRAFGMCSILRHPVWRRRFEFNLTAGSRGEGTTAGQRQAVLKQGASFCPGLTPFVLFIGLG